MRARMGARDVAHLLHGDVGGRALVRNGVGCLHGQHRRRCPARRCTGSREGTHTEARTTIQDCGVSASQAAPSVHTGEKRHCRSDRNGLGF